MSPSRYDRYHSKMLTELERQESRQRRGDILPWLLKATTIAALVGALAFGFLSFMTEGSQTDVITKAVLIGCLIFGAIMVLGALKIGRP
jgi:uncharacterized membrane protein YkvI